MPKDTSHEEDPQPPNIDVISRAAEIPQNMPKPPYRDRILNPESIPQNNKIPKHRQETP